VKPVWTRTLAALFAVCAVLVLWLWESSASSRTRPLPDGSALTLEDFAFTKGQLRCVYEPGGAFGKLIEPIAPQTLRDRFDLGVRRELDVGGAGGSNFCFIALNGCRKPGWETSIVGAELFDDEGNISDVYQSDSFQYPHIAVNGGVFRIFPRRSREIGLRFFTQTTDGAWTNAAEFRMPNPFCAVYPQWTAERWPVTRRHGELQVTLEEFRTGAHESDPRGLSARRDDDAVVSHNTMARFSFAEGGVPSDNWRVENLIISDATGNRMSRELTDVRRTIDERLLRPGTVELCGALWPGESAWRLQVEVVRSGGFASNDLWTIPIQLPPPGGELAFTNSWLLQNVRIKLSNVSLQNLGRDSGLACWLRMNVEGLAPGFGVFVVRARDRDGKAVPFTHYENRNSWLQWICLVPELNATAIFLTLTVQRSVFEEFTARPEFLH